MKVITITREYGAGGLEVAKLLAKRLGWPMLDRELLHQAAAIENVPDADLERLDEKAIRMVDRLRLHPPHQKYIHGLTEAVRRAVARGPVILVGRGARHLLGDMPEAFHLRLVAPLERRVERMARLENVSLEDAKTQCVRIDRIRSRFMRYFFGDAAQQPSQYDLIANTGRVSLENVADWVAAVADEKIMDLAASQSPALSDPAEKGRVLTLSRELGAGDTGFAPSLADRLRLHVFDRELLERDAHRLALPEPEIERYDEQPSGVFEHSQSENHHRQYLEAMEQVMHELAEQGDVVLVGRGGNCFLKEHPRAFHVRLVAPPNIRLHRVMEYRWVRESVAKKLMAESDAQRRRFHQSCFGVDWTDPLEYHITVNSGRLMLNALDLVAMAAEQHWNRTT